MLTNLLIQLLLALAIGINVITWIIEFEKKRFITFFLDITLTLLLVKLAGGTALLNAAILYSSLIISYKLNMANSKSLQLDKKIFKAK